MSDKNFLEQINKEKEMESKAESFQKEVYVPTKRRRSVIPYAFVIVLLILSAAIYYFLFVPSVVIVDFTGMALEQVQSFADSKDIMLLSQEEYDSLVDENLVLSQNHAPGHTMRAQDTLVVTVSGGPDPFAFVQLPEFDDSWSQSAVLQWLESQKVDNFAFRYIDSEDVAGDYFIDYVLTGATVETFNRSASIEIILSQPDGTATVQMPNFLGATLTSFDIWTGQEGFSYTYTEAYSDLYPLGQIMSQDFRVNEELLTTDTLTVIVSKGPLEDMVEMIGLVNQTLADAIAWLSANGLDSEVTYRFSSDFEAGRVMVQDVTAGDEIPRGQTVNLEVAMGEANTVPDFSGFSSSNYQVAASHYIGPVYVRDVYDQTVSAGQLISQSLRPGSAFSEPLPVEVVYSLGNSLMIPDFRMGTINQITEWIDLQNDRGAAIELAVIEDPSLNGDYGVIFDQNHYNKSIGLNEKLVITVSTRRFIPDFSTMTIEEALAYADNSSLSVIINESYQVDSSAGDFIRQSVPAGQKALVDSIVTVSYSLGSQILLADYRNLPLSDLTSQEAALEADGFSMDIQVYEVYDNNVPDGYIIDQNIYNQFLYFGEAVDVVVSLGEKYLVGNYRGRTRSSMENLARTSNLNFVFEVVPSTQPSGTVVSQSVNSGTIISKADFIYISISD